MNLRNNSIHYQPWARATEKIYDVAFPAPFNATDDLRWVTENHTDEIRDRVHSYLQDYQFAVDIGNKGNYEQ